MAHPHTGNDMGEAYLALFEETRTGEFSPALTDLDAGDQQILLSTVLGVPEGPELYREVIYGGKITGGDQLVKPWLEALPQDSRADTLAGMYLWLLENNSPAGDIRSLNEIVAGLMEPMSDAERAAFAATLVDHDPQKLAPIMNEVYKSISGSLIPMLLRMQSPEVDLTLSAFSATSPIAIAWQALKDLDELAGNHDLAQTYTSFLSYVSGSSSDDMQIFDYLSPTQSGALLGSVPTGTLSDYLSRTLPTGNKFIKDAIDSIPPDMLMKALFAMAPDKAKTTVDSLSPLGTAGSIWLALKAYTENGMTGGTAAVNDIAAGYKRLISKPMGEVSSPEFAGLSAPRKIALLSLLPQSTAIKAVDTMTAAAKTDLFNLDRDVHLAWSLLLAMDADKRTKILHSLPWTSRMRDIWQALIAYTDQRQPNLLSIDQAYKRLVSDAADMATDDRAFKALAPEQRATLTFSLPPYVASDVIEALKPSGTQMDLLLAAKPEQAMPAIIVFGDRYGDLGDNNGLFVSSPLYTIGKALEALAEADSQSLETSYATLIRTPEIVVATAEFTGLPAEQQAALLALIPPSRRSMTLTSMPRAAVSPLLVKGLPYILMPLLLDSDPGDVDRLLGSLSKDNSLRNAWQALGAFGNAAMDRRIVYEKMTKHPEEIFLSATFTALSTQEKSAMVFSLPPAQAGPSLSILRAQGDFAALIANPYLAIPALVNGNSRQVKAIIEAFSANHPVRETWEALTALKDESGKDSHLEAYSELREKATAEGIDSELFETLKALAVPLRERLLSLLPPAALVKATTTFTDWAISARGPVSEIIPSLLAIDPAAAQGAIDALRLDDPVLETWRAVHAFADKLGEAGEDRLQRAYNTLVTAPDTVVHTLAFTGLTLAQQSRLLTLLSSQSFEAALFAMEAAQRQRVFSVMRPYEVISLLAPMARDKANELTDPLPAENLVRAVWEALSHYADSKGISIEEAYLKVRTDFCSIMFDHNSLTIEKKAALALILPPQDTRTYFEKISTTSIIRGAAPYVIMPIFLLGRSPARITSIIEEWPAENPIRMAWEALKEYRTDYHRPHRAAAYYDGFLHEIVTGELSKTFATLTDKYQQALLLTLLPVPSGAAGPELYVELMYGNRIAGGYDIGEPWLKALPKDQQADTLAEMYLLLLQRDHQAGIDSLSAMVKDLLRVMSEDDRNEFTATLLGRDPDKMAEIVDDLFVGINGSISTARTKASDWFAILEFLSVKDIRGTLRGLEDKTLVADIVELMSPEKRQQVFDLPLSERIVLLLDIMTLSRAEALTIDILPDNSLAVKSWYALKAFKQKASIPDLKRTYDTLSAGSLSDQNSDFFRQLTDAEQAALVMALHFFRAKDMVEKEIMSSTAREYLVDHYPARSMDILTRIASDKRKSFVDDLPDNHLMKKLWLLLDAIASDNASIVSARTLYTGLKSGTLSLTSFSDYLLLGDY